MLNGGMHPTSEFQLVGVGRDPTHSQAKRQRRRLERHQRPGASPSLPGLQIEDDLDVRGAATSHI